MKNVFTLLFLIITILNTAIAQSPTQTIRGIVIDQQTTMPLIGATVQVTSIEIPKGVSTDVDGRFKLAEIPVGRHNLVVSYIGYEDMTVPNVVVTSGKEVVLEIGLEEAIIQAAEVVVTAKTKKEGTVNELATISSRSFNTEEVRRFSGGRSDVAHLVRNFAGVSSSNDSRNDIVIRGNSPTGVLWRMEGVAIPNPNHFATLGTTGGPVNALNTNLLKTSDFMTGAFTAEYGNALAGVFDINLRKGNDEKVEFTGQVGFNGFEGIVEGPINKKNRGSYVASYRYSVIGLLGSLVDIGTSGIPEYQDLTFKINFGSGKAGRFTLFGMGATSDIAFFGAEAGDDDFYADQSFDSRAGSDLGILGLSHNLILNNKTYLKTVLSSSYSRSRFSAERIEADSSRTPDTRTRDVTMRYTLSSYLNHKINARHTVRAGVIADYFDLDLNVEQFEDDEWIPRRAFNDGMSLFQTYVQTQYRLNEKWTLNGGLHAQYLGLNDDIVLEPRGAINWEFVPQHKLSLGYGLHNQMQPFPIYFMETQNTDGTFTRTNEDLGFSAANHIVLGYDASLSSDWRVKADFYYQSLNNVPIDATPSAFSLLNAGADFTFPTRANLVNEGTGTNYGMELTLEKFYSKGYYGLVTVSLFDSKYTGSDGIERNTAFNNRYVFNVLGGKEFKIGKANAITVDFKATRAGGRFFTPIDLEASKSAGREIRDWDNIFGAQYPDYFRFDIKFGFRLNGEKVSQLWSIDLQNVLDRQNVFSQSYNAATESITTTYQLGFFPDVTYRIEF